MAHRPRKRFSQNFLIDESVIDAIVRAVGPRPDEILVEIGPGFGALTKPLSSAVQRLHVIEIDRDIVKHLRAQFSPEHVIVHEGDALKFDFAALGARLRVIGNLPYHISTPILFHLVAIAERLQDIHVMLQAEVVQRMTAAAGSSEYGRLSVMLQYYFDIEKVLDVSAAAFRPVPNVESSVARMVPRAGCRRARSETMFAETVALAFSQRRKTLRNTLGRALPATAFDALGIDPHARAQTLAVDQFLDIADYRSARQREQDQRPGLP